MSRPPTPRSNRYSGLPPAKPDVVFALNSKAVKDVHPDKVNLVIGAYRNAAGKPYLLDAVREAEHKLESAHMDKEYQGIAGHQGFLQESAKLLLGRELASPQMLDRVAAAQTIGGTGAVRLAAELMALVAGLDTPVYISDPTWPNHPAIFSKAGFKNIRKYRYFDAKSNLVDFKNFHQDLSDAPDGSIVVFHLCAHNPTGADPTPEQWEKLAELSSQKKFHVIFDAAYQGYASGSLDRDARAARIFAEKGIEFSCAQSYSKNMGLYGERLGCYMVVCGTVDSAKLVGGTLKNIIRPMYSNPPLHGARVAYTILNDKYMRKEWEEELRGMAHRVINMRTCLYEELLKLKTPGNWDHIIKQIGMFSYTGLSKKQCQMLVENHHIYIMLSGRANMAGLTRKTAKRFAHAIDRVVRDERPVSKL